MDKMDKYSKAYLCWRGNNVDYDSGISSSCCDRTQNNIAVIEDKGTG